MAESREGAGGPCPAPSPPPQGTAAAPLATFLEDLGCLAAAGLAVADLCAVLPAPDQPLCSNRAHGQRLPAGCCPAVPPGPPPGQPATSPDRAQQQQQGPISTQPCAGHWAVPQANSVQEAEAGVDVEEGAHPPRAGGASGSRELAVSVRRAVQLLPSWAPGVQLLLLPALLPTTGRAAVRGPARSSSAGPTASRVSAPRLLQLSVPVFSELRCTLTEAFSAARSAGLDNSTGDYAAPGESVMPFTDGVQTEMPQEAARRLHPLSRLSCVIVVCKTNADADLIRRVALSCIDRP
ncbi:hypothetical protein V8C86DRAFT_2472178 [Haematococcus lacustris]